MVTFINHAASPCTLTNPHPHMHSKVQDHITPILQELHWLPFETRIDHKCLSFQNSCVNGTASPPPPSPNHHFLSSTFSANTTFQCTICSPPSSILLAFPMSTKKTTKTSCSRSNFQCCAHVNCETVCPSLGESLVRRKPSRKT